MFGPPSFAVWHVAHFALKSFAPLAALPSSGPGIVFVCERWGGTVSASCASWEESCILAQQCGLDLAFELLTLSFAIDQKAVAYLQKTLRRSTPGEANDYARRMVVFIGELDAV